MVTGLDLFRSHFQAYADRYLLIGGAACDLLMSEAGVDFRATKDLDIVLCVEALDRPFVTAFWEFVKLAGYQSQEKATGERQFYRFQKPKFAEYPFMLELFSRSPDALSVAPGGHLTPLPIDEEISSLSAILLDNDYYEFIRSGRTEREGLPLVGVEHLIPLKARAWLDLTQRQKDGDAGLTKSIRKHRNDVFRLYQIMDPDAKPAIPETVKRDLGHFVEAIESEPVDLKALNVRTGTLDEILQGLRAYYDLGAAPSPI